MSKRGSHRQREVWVDCTESDFEFAVCDTPLYARLFENTRREDDEATGDSVAPPGDADADADADVGVAEASDSSDSSSDDEAVDAAAAGDDDGDSDDSEW